jgi:RHS repeat-associated protein
MTILQALLEKDFDFKRVTEPGHKTGTAAAHEKLELSTLVSKSGYLYIYLSNENDKIVDVYFDDLKITHTHSPIVQAADYYPFGMTFNSYQRTNSAEQRYLYNGKEKQDLSDWMDYGARMYMPEIGRWAVVDPLADQMRR